MELVVVVGVRVGPTGSCVDHSGSCLPFSSRPLSQSCAAARRARARLAPGPTLARRDAELQFFISLYFSSLRQAFDAPSCDASARRTYALRAWSGQ